MIALVGGANVVTSGFSARKACPQRLHVKPSSITHHIQSERREKI